jgi:hypothetical protein
MYSVTIAAARPNPSVKPPPTAGRPGRQALGLRPILRLLSSAPRRRRPLGSHVRHHNRVPRVTAVPAFHLLPGYSRRIY